MSATIDPNKLKVAELREELQTRGLDTKGNKPVLVKRLKKALEAELSQELPDTSIADTSTEELETSQDVSIQESESKSKKQEQEDEDQSSPDDGSTDVQTMDVENENALLESDTEEKSNEEEDPKNKPSDQTASEQSEEKDDVEKADEVSQDKTENESEDVEMTPKTDAEAEAAPKGEKRKHSRSPSPERASQRRRSRSPPKEDEPPIDSEKVLLSWYDSDLHLQVDKETFLSAKPYHEGVFGYAWAGARASHGVVAGKVRYEVKITEQLKWEDFSNINARRDRSNNQKRDREREKSRRESKSESDKKDGDKKENGHKNESGEKFESKKEETLVENDGKVEKKEEEKTGEKMDVTEETAVEAMDEESEKKEENVKEDEDSEKKVDEKKEDSENKEDSDKKEDSEKKEEKPEEEKKVEEKEEEIVPIPSHLLRVGWSLSNCSLQLGEEAHSYGYESSGKFMTNKELEDYGVAYKVGDVVGAYLNVTDETVEISYTVNGELHSQATSVPRSEFPEDDFALFPHILSRNYVFELNFGNREEAWFPNPEDLSDYVFLVDAEEKIQGLCRPENRNECETILMFGLPASGKTHWVQQHVKANPTKKYTLIGNSHLLERMTVNGQPLKANFKGRWSGLLDKLQRCLIKLTELAPIRRRNYIIDQTNVFPSAQRRKMRPFEGFQRRAVIVVVGEEEQAKRQSLQETQEGKGVPDSALLELKANMSLPTKCEWIDEVVYADLNEEEAKEVVTKYNADGKKAGFGPGGRKSTNRDSRRWPSRYDHHSGGYRDRGYQRYDRGPRPTSGSWGGRPGGGWNRDRHDSRGPPMRPPGGSRDWRSGSGGRPADRPPRDNRIQQGGNRNRNQGGAGGWAAGGGAGGAGAWGGQGWGQNWGGGQGWGGQGQWNQNAQWSKYGGGQQGYGGGGQQGYGGGWNYYGQYAQNWNGQQQ